jgi:hypothetical protein
MKTVAELFSDIKAQAGNSGVCDVQDIMRRMNIIGPELLDEIDAKGTLWTWCFPVCGNCVVMPTDIQQVLQAAVCGTAVTQRSEFWAGRMMGNEWADGWTEVPWSTLIELHRTSATHFPVEPAQLNESFAFQAKNQADVGKEVEIRWRVKKTGKEFVVRHTLQGDQRIAMISGDPVGEVAWLHKPRTKGNVLLWVMNQDTGAARLVSSYDPREEIPEYKMFQLTGHPKCAEMSVRGKKRWIDLRDENDLVPFGRVMAWRNALMAEAASEEGKLQERAQFMAAAVQDLEREKRGWESPNNQRAVQVITPWSVGAGSSSVGRRGYRGVF